MKEEDVHAEREVVLVIGTAWRPRAGAAQQAEAPAPHAAGRARHWACISPASSRTVVGTCRRHGLRMTSVSSSPAPRVILAIPSPGRPQLSSGVPVPPVHGAPYSGVYFWDTRNLLTNSCRSEERRGGKACRSRWS